jgi:hypothetical protein
MHLSLIIIIVVVVVVVIIIIKVIIIIIIINSCYPLGDIGRQSSFSPPF